MHGSPFTNVATGFPGITSAAATLLHDGIGKPPEDLRSIGEKTYAAFTKGDFKGEKCRIKNWRNFPYALWLDQNRGLAGDRKLFDRYYHDHLLPAINTKRRPMKWIKPLIFVYVHDFRPENRDFDYLARRIRDAFKNERILANEKIKALIDQLNFFDPDEGPRKTGQSIISSDATIESWPETHGLWTSFISSGFCKIAFQKNLNVSNNIRTSEKYIERITLWASQNKEGNNNDITYPDLRPNISSSLLLPWLQDKPTQPPDLLKKSLIHFFTKYYGDPVDFKSGGNKNRWSDSDPRCPNIILNWMVGDTLKAFFKILEITADEIWKDRQKFWLAYYDRGLIDEAWVVLGPTAQNRAYREFSDRNLNYGKLQGGTSKQSVLLLKMNNMVFCEWSHKGKLRAGIEHRPSIPQLYKNIYDADRLRFTSMDFNDGENLDPGLIHFSSDSGGWQDRARNFIRKHLGHNLPLSEVC